MKKGFVQIIIVLVILLTVVVGLGTYFLFISKNNQVTVDNQNTSKTNSSLKNDIESELIPNNKGKIAYIENGSTPIVAEEASNLSVIKIVNQDGSDTKEVDRFTPGGFSLDNLSWSPDGSYLAIYSKGGGGLLEIVKIDKEISKPLDMPGSFANNGNLLDFTWSADSKKVAYFVGNSPVKLEIYDIVKQRVLKTEQINNKKFLHSFGYEMAWTSQNNIIYLSNTENKTLKLLIYNVSSRAFSEKVLATNVDDTSDTKLLFYPNTNRGLIMLKDLTNGDEIWSVDGNGIFNKVWSVGKLDTCGIEGWISGMSYDAKYVVAYLGCPRPYPENFKKRTLDPASFLINTETGTHIDVTKNVPQTWSPGNKEFVARNEKGLGIYDLKGQKIRQLLESKSAEYSAWNPQ